MTSKRDLARQLGPVTDFDDPSPALEQYPTPAELAATIVHTAGLHGDIGANPVVDIGCGTGMLAVAGALAGATEVVGIDIDRHALEIARDNWKRVEPGATVSWIQGDVTNPPLEGVPGDKVTAIMNPPFGAQNGNKHADRPFLRAAADIASVSYSIHNGGSQSFVESFTADLDGEVTHAFKASIDLSNRFDFHTADSTGMSVEIFRISWSK